MKLHRETGALFGEKHSWQDYGLIMTCRPIIGSPKPKISGVGIQGADGELDLTEPTSGEVRYEKRELEFHFSAAPKWQNELHSLLLADLHGQVMNIVLDEDDAYYYRGRVTVDDPERDRQSVNWTVRVSAEPYKLRREITTKEYTVDAFTEAMAWFGTVPRNQPDRPGEWQALFQFGAAYGGGDFSMFDDIRLYWDPTVTWRRSTATVTVTDNSGSYSWTIGNTGGGSWIATKAEITAAGVTLNAIRQIKLDGVCGGSLYAKAEKVWWKTLQNDRKTVTPEVFCDSGLAGTYMMLGKQSAVLAQGWNCYPGLQLHRGDVSVIIINTTGNERSGSLFLRYREGAL